MTGGGLPRPCFTMPSSSHTLSITNHSECAGPEEAAKKQLADPKEIASCDIATFCNLERALLLPQEPRPAAVALLYKINGALCASVFLDARGPPYGFYTRYRSPLARNVIYDNYSPHQGSPY
jgi:hypothetical protein